MLIIAIEAEAFFEAPEEDLEPITRALIQLRKRGVQVVRLEPRDSDWREFSDDPGWLLSHALVLGTSQVVGMKGAWAAAVIGTSITPWDHGEDMMLDTLLRARHWLMDEDERKLVVVGPNVQAGPLGVAREEGLLQECAAVRHLDMASLSMIAGAYSGWPLFSRDMGGLSSLHAGGSRE